MKTQLFRDTEHGEIITTEQLFEEYTAAMNDGEHDSMTFGEFVYNCTTAAGGTLKEIDSVKR